MSWNAGDMAQNMQKNKPLFESRKMKPIKSLGDRRVKLTFSEDDGTTWAQPIDLTNELTPKCFVWDVMGPGNGIQT